MLFYCCCFFLTLSATAAAASSAKATTPSSAARGVLSFSALFMKIINVQIMLTDMPFLVNNMY